MIPTTHTMIAPLGKTHEERKAEARRAIDKLVEERMKAESEEDTKITAQQLEELLNPASSSPQNQTANTLLNITPNINRADYIQVPQSRILIAKAETHKGKTWHETHYALQETGLYMPAVCEGITHWLNVREAALTNNRILYDGNNAPIRKEEAVDLWNYMSSGHRGGCWSWFDAFFTDENTLHQYHLMNKDAAGKKTLESQSKPALQCPIKENCYVELDFNSQGMPLKKSSMQQYQQGQNLYFYFPRSNAVARLSAGAGLVSLDCCRVPRSSDASLGVFGVARSFFSLRFIFSGQIKK